MNTCVRSVGKVSRLLARLGGGLILFSAFLVSLDVVFRNLFKLSIFESFELTGYAIALATVFGLAWALITKAHIRIEVLYTVMPRSIRTWMDVFALGTLALVAGALTYYGVLVVLDNVALDARSNSTLHIPLAIPQSLWALGLGWFAVCATVLFAIAVSAAIRGRHDQVQEMFGIASVEEEVKVSMDGTNITPVDRGVRSGGPIGLQSGAKTC